MKKFICFLLVFTIVSGYVLLITIAPAGAASMDDKKAAAFYKGKTVQYVVPYGPGGGYDTWARIVNPYLAKYLGARVIVRNEPGAGGKVAVNRLQKKRDGLSMVSVSVQSLILDQVYQSKGVRYDLSQFNWLGRMEKTTYPVCVGAKSRFKSIKDLQSAKEVKYSTDSKSSTMGMRGAVAGFALGINMRIVAGYRGTAAAILAVQKGEVDAMSAPTTTVFSYIKSGDLIPLFVMDHKRFKDFPNIPTVYEVKKLSAKEKEIVDIMASFDSVGRTVATTPGVPMERVLFLESALKKALEEPEVKAKAKKLGGAVAYSSGKEVARAINRLSGLSGEEKAFFGKLLGMKGYK